MTRTVRDAAMLPNVLAAKDPLDPATQGHRIRARGRRCKSAGRH
jgi:Asp-tRNA(Asn)/Glu-tRNA(Gln) amidotransferase A subunit family amidase